MSMLLLLYLAPSTVHSLHYRKPCVSDEVNQVVQPDLILSNHQAIVCSYLWAFLVLHFKFEVAAIWCRIRLYRPYCKLLNLLTVWLPYINNVKTYHLATVVYIRKVSSSLDCCFLYFFPYSLGLFSNHNNSKLASSHYEKKSEYL